MDDISYAPLIDKMLWSYSRVKSFTDCKYAWYLKYIWKQGEYVDQFFSQYGTLIHDILAKRLTGQLGEEDAVDAYLLRFAKEVTAPAPSDKILENYFEDGILAVQTLPIVPGEHIVGVEQRVKFEYAGRPFVGYIDLVTETDSGDLIAVTDHKSRVLAPRSKRKTPTQKDAELDEYLKQLYCYGAAVEKLYGKKPTELRLNSFRRQILIREPYREDRAEEAEDWCRNTIEEVRGTTEFPPDIDWFRCTWLCDVHDHCEFYDSVRKR